MSDGIVGAIAISLFGGEKKLMTRTSTAAVGPDGMDAGYGMLGHDLDVCRMFDQYTYKPSKGRGISHGRAHRFYNAFFDHLKRAMNFTTAQILPVDTYGDYNSTTNNWSGAMGLLTQGKADLPSFGLAMIEPRRTAIDFTQPVLTPSMKLFIRQPDPILANWLAHFKVFSLEIWVIMIALVITTPLLLAFIKGQKGSKSLGSLYLENFIGVWGIFCQQGLHTFPAKAPMRIVVISIYITAVVAYVAYTAKLISFLTVSDVNLPFSDLDGFCKDGTYKLAVRQRYLSHGLPSFAVGLITKKMMKLMKPIEYLPQTMENAWEQICNERVAFYADELSGSNPNATCKVVQIETGVVARLAMALPAGSQYTGIVNYHIQRFRENGILHDMDKTRFDPEQSVESARNVVDFYSVALIFSILAGGIILALVVLFCELIYFRIHSRGWMDSHRIELPKKRMHRSDECGIRSDLSIKAPRPCAPLRNQNCGKAFIEYCS